MNWKLKIGHSNMGEDNEARGCSYAVVQDSEEWNVAEIWGDAPNAAKNAALIVRAVNSHEALLEALREMLKFGYHGKHRAGYGSCGLCDSRKLAQAAIKLAEGGE